MNEKELELHKKQKEKDVQLILNVLEGKRIGYAREVIKEVDIYLTYEAHFTLKPKDPSL